MIVVTYIRYIGAKNLNPALGASAQLQSQLPIWPDVPTYNN